MRKVILLLILLVLCFVSACRAEFEPETVTPAPHASAALTPTPFSVYAPTVEMSFEELVGDDGYYRFPKGFPASDTYRVTVDIYHQVVLVCSKDGAGEYTVPVRYMLCSSGANGKTPVGTFKLMNYRVRFGLFVNDGVCGQYWSQIKNRIYFHSILYTKKDASAYIKEAYDNLGKPVSHGCIRLTVPDARWIYYNLAPGTMIEIREGSADDKETALIRSSLVLAPSPEERVKLKKGGAPNTDNWRIEDVPCDVPFVQGSQK